MHSPSAFSRVGAKQRVLGAFLLASLLATACGSPEGADPSASEEVRPTAGEAIPAQEPKGAVVPAPPTGRVILTPTSKAPSQFQRHPVTGRTIFRAAPAKQLFRYAYDIDSRETILEVPIDLSTHYDVVVEPPNRRLETARQLLQQRLEDEFNVETTLTYRTVPVLVIRRTEEDAQPLAPASSPRRVVGGLGRFEGRRASLEDLVRFTRTFSERPVIDQTGLVGVYDIMLEWDPKGGHEAYRGALREQGLELVPSVAPVQHLVIRRPAAPAPVAP